MLTRLSPQEAAEYWFETGNSRLSAQINAVMTPKRAVQLLAPYIPSGDEHLLIANSVSEPQEKLIQLNLYFESMGLLPVSLIDNKKKIDIGNISTNTNRSPKSRPTVSVVMTVFNGHKYIRAAALSVIQQIDVNTELIIIDDGSTDNTWKIICELQQEHPTHIRCKRLITNIGTYNAKNIGLRLCRSDYIAFQDADDWSHPERLKRAITWLQKSSQRVAVTCRYVRLNEDSIFHSPAIWPMRQWSPNTLVFRRREVLSKIGGFDTVQVGADTEYFERIRAVFGDKRIAIQNHVALLAMSLPTSLMHNPNTGPDATGYSSTRIAYREKSAEKILQSIESSQNLRMPL
ncbi:glycosyltransferase family 2 protein [Achromobacter agilis]|uniref:glycosyltransferase family 2 protein n=1 Tax=Achromobacter agilis TaxID=1353888 RepID=UPI0013EB4868|nr:glycosyltransferase family A protein [Achromobacter agilis]